MVMEHEPKDTTTATMVGDSSANNSDFEVDSHDFHLQSKIKTARLLDGARVSLTAFALLAGITILGVSADALAVYDATHLGPEFNLPLWPDSFDLRPTVALVVGSAIVTLTNIASLLFSRVHFLRSRTPIHTPMMFVAPLVGLVAAIIAMGYFYSVNASITADTLQSWSCRWSNVVMVTRPQWGTLCKESMAGLYLSIILIPIEALILGAASWQAVLERSVVTAAHGGKRVSPPLKGRN